MGKSYISLKERKKSQVAHSCTYMFVYLKIKRKDKCSLCKFGLFFFFFASYRKFVWWMGGFSGALNSANRYLMYDIKLIYENKTGVHTYFFSGLNICDSFWFCFVSFCFFFFFYPLSFLFLFTWIVVENFLLKREWNKQLHLFHIDG